MSLPFATMLLTLQDLILLVSGRVLRLYTARTLRGDSWMAKPVSNPPEIEGQNQWTFPVRFGFLSIWFPGYF
jgi:hypothetical protein